MADIKKHFKHNDMVLGVAGKKQTKGAGNKIGTPRKVKIKEGEDDPEIAQ